jgi:hypothetical protein
MGNFLDLNQQYPSLPNARALTIEQDTLRIKMLSVPVANSTVQWHGDLGMLQTNFGEVFQFTRDAWLDWFDRSKAEYEYSLRGS